MLGLKVETHVKVRTKNILTLYNIIKVEVDRVEMEKLHILLGGIMMI
jgi:hypothetical protein